MGRPIDPDDIAEELQRANRRLDLRQPERAAIILARAEVLIRRLAPSTSPSTLRWLCADWLWVIARLADVANMLREVARWKALRSKKGGA